MNSVSDVWKRVLEILKGSLTPVAISTWFDDCRPVELTDNRIVIYTPSDFRKGIIETRFMQPIKSALFDIFACDIEVKMLGEGELETFRAAAPSSTSISDSDDFTFERFVVGNSNKFAHAAAMAVAEGQTKNFNPLFIYGDSGLGKTHLLYAIRHAVRRNHPNYNIVYVKGDDFTNELISAIQTGRNVEFREKYRSADLFLMDDIQFIAGKPSTQEEFFHTFNTLYESKHQIVFTSDRPPNEMTLLADRLRSRFESGIIADIQPPDYETRVAIIRNKSSQLGLQLSDDVITYIAENLTANVRQIEGAVKKISAYRDLMKDDSITVQTATQIIKDLFREKSEYIPTPNEIIEATAKYYSLSSDELKGQRRTRKTALARHISMYIIRKLTNLSLDDIGVFYERRDHTTVMSSIRKIEEGMKDSSDLAQTVKDITATINSRN
jgi:chromosomal replication initiator protein